MTPSSTWGLAREVATGKINICSLCNAYHHDHTSPCTHGLWFHPQTSLKSLPAIILTISRYWWNNIWNRTPVLRLFHFISRLSSMPSLVDQLPIYSCLAEPEVKRISQFGAWACLKMGYRPCGMLLTGKVILCTTGILLDFGVPKFWDDHRQPHA